MPVWPIPTGSVDRQDGPLTETRGRRRRHDSRSVGSPVLRFRRPESTTDSPHPSPIPLVSSINRRWGWVVVGWDLSCCTRLIAGRARVRSLLIQHALVVDARALRPTLHCLAAVGGLESTRNASSADLKVALPSPPCGTTMSENHGRAFVVRLINHIMCLQVPYDVPQPLDLCICKRVLTLAPKCRHRVDSHKDSTVYKCMAATPERPPAGLTPPRAAQPRVHACAAGATKVRDPSEKMRSVLPSCDLVVYRKLPGPSLRACISGISALPLLVLFLCALRPWCVCTSKSSAEYYV